MIYGLWLDPHDNSEYDTSHNTYLIWQSKELYKSMLYTWYMMHKTQWQSMSMENWEKLCVHDPHSKLL